jgi:hypothetical protein
MGSSEIKSSCNGKQAYTVINWRYLGNDKKIK